MTTRQELVDEITSNLQGFGLDLPASTHLTAPVSASDLTLPLADASVAGRGLLEIDHELIWCTTVDPALSQAVVAPYGRAYRGSGAASHAAGSEVRVAPVWPRNSIISNINTAIDGLWPSLYGVTAADTFVLSGTTYQFAMPANLERVVDVRWRLTTLEGWQRCRAWEVEHLAPVNPGSPMLSIYGDIPPGATVQVLYAHRPTSLVNDSDVFADVTGLADQVKDVVVLSVMARMVRFLDLGRLPNRDSTGDQRQLGSATDVANDLFRQFQVRLAEEQSALAVRFPARYHRVR